MRKLVSYIILLFCFILTGNFVYADNTKKALYTDITAYINGVSIPCYEVDGKIAIIAEDLEDYGFHIEYSFESTWQGKKPILEITYHRKNISLNALENIEKNNISSEKQKYAEQYFIDYGKEITANYCPEQNKKEPGSVAFYLYQTNLSTRIYYYSNEIPCYSIGGKTMIFMDSLKKTETDIINYENNTNIIWHPEEKKIYFEYLPDWSVFLVNGNDGNYTNEDNIINDFSIQFTKNNEGNFDVIRKNIKYLDYNINLEYHKNEALGGLKLEIYSFYNENIPPRKLKYQFVNFDDITVYRYDDYDDEYQKENIDFINEHIKLYINDKKLNIYSGIKNPGGNHIIYTFYFDEKISNFDEIQMIKLECK